MKPYFLFFAFLVTNLIVYPQKKAIFAPINPDFITYTEQIRNNAVSNLTPDGHSLGYRPSPLVINTKPDNIKNDINKSAEAFPARYDLRDLGYVTVPKDQGSIGACWTFGVIGAIESSWLLQGKGTNDLSEENMSTCHGFVWGKNEGGNFEIATAYLNTFKGPLSEDQDPYISNSSVSVCKTFDETPVAYVPEARWLDNDINNLKEAIMRYGGVAASIKMGEYENYYNATDHTYYYSGKDIPDHGVLIVGWDDNKVVTGGAASPEEHPTGAWIVKNSWGTDFGENGFFYTSYKDVSIALKSTYFPTYYDLDRIDKIFSYDDLGATTSIGYNQYYIYGLVKYNASSKTYIDRIGTYAIASNTTIDIEIYKTKTGNTLSDLVGSSYGNQCPLAGFYLLDIAAVVEGDFYIKVKYSCPFYSYILPIEKVIKGYAYPVIKQDVGWLSSDNIEWEPVGKNIDAYQFDICIRAYGTQAKDPQAFFVSDKKEICKNSSLTFTDNSKGSITTYAWNFGANASPQTANTAGPHIVTYSTSGLKTISLTVTGAGGTNTLTRSNYINVVDNIYVFVPVDTLYDAKGNTVNLTAFGADDYSWSPATDLDTTKGQTVTATVNNSITYTITGTQGSCTDHTSITIIALNNPDNDNVCNATQVIVGTNGPYTNLYATVQPGEPYPPLSGCDTLKSWCDEYGHGQNPLDHTVWFYFTGTAAGEASFELTMFDNQIALYKATTCNDILNNNYELIAANDDFFVPDTLPEGEKPPPETYRAAIDVLPLTQGEKYWIQVDGSGGGKIGQFEIIIREGPIPLEDINESVFSKSDFLIFPNPNRGIFNLKYTGNNSINLNLKVFDLEGKLMYYNCYPSISKNFNTGIELNNFQAGMYIIKIEIDTEVIYNKIIIK